MAAKVAAVSGNTERVCNTVSGRGRDKLPVSGWVCPDVTAHSNIHPAVQYSDLTFQTGWGGRENLWTQTSRIQLIKVRFNSRG